MVLFSALAIKAQTANDSTYQLTAQDSINMRQYDLKGVTVEGVRKYVKNDIDRLTYDVQHDDDSKTKSVLEMLRKVPMVTVDGQDNIRVKGQTSFKVYKNGHPDPVVQQPERGTNSKVDAGFRHKEDRADNRPGGEV